MKLLVDTQVLAVLLAGSENISKESYAELLAAAENGELCVSIVSLLQLREAVASRMKKLDEWMLNHAAHVLPIDLKVYASMSKAHENETMADRLILATARSEDLRLATFREYNDPDIEFLRCKRA